MAFPFLGLVTYKDTKTPSQFTHFSLYHLYFDPTPFAQLRNIFTLLDLDTSNTAAQKAFIGSCKGAGIDPTQLARYCLESYYTLQAIRETFGQVVPAHISTLDEKVPPWKQLADTLHDENWWKGELKSARRIFSILNHMTLSDIEDTDLIEFCKRIKSTL